MIVQSDYRNCGSQQVHHLYSISNRGHEERGEKGEEDKEIKVTFWTTSFLRRNIIWVCGRDTSARVDVK